MNCPTPTNWLDQRWFHVPTYLYVQDLWPENVETVTGIHNKAIIGPIDKMVDKIYKNTGTIFTTSPSFVKAIVNRKVPFAIFALQLSTFLFYNKQTSFMRRNRCEYKGRIYCCIPKAR